MRWFVVLVAALSILGFCLAQDYRPKAGETIMKVVVEGKGSIFIKLHTREAPKATRHIISLARSGFYDGQSFFRVVKSPRPFLVQTGDPNSRTRPADDASLGTGGTGARIPYEDSGYSNETGAVGLATVLKDRDAGDSQFYILLASSKFLDGNYTVFGKVVEGMDVVSRIDRGDRVVSVTILGG